MSSSLHHIDLAEVLERYHRRCQTTVPFEPSNREQGDTCEITRDDNDDGDNISTVSYLTSSGWDETIMDQNKDALTSWQLRQATGKFVTPHAIAIQSCVYGTLDCPSKNDAGKRLEIRWKTSFAPHRVHQIASNEGGTIIAATTDNGSVSILRGRDGKVLATRRLSHTTMMDRNGDPVHSWCCPSVSFVVQTTIDSRSRGDALLIQIPSSNQPALLVSNIQGEQIDDRNDAVVAQATQAINLHSVQIPVIPHRDIMLMEAYFVPKINESDLEESTMEDSKIRLVIVYEPTFQRSQKRLGLAEYSLVTESTEILTTNLIGDHLGGIEIEEEWEIDLLAGLHLQPACCFSAYLLAFVVHSSKLRGHVTTKICLFDPNCQTEALDASSQDNPLQAKLLGEYVLRLVANDENLHSREGSQQIRVMSITSAHPCDGKAAVSYILSLRDGGHCETQVLQAPINLRKDQIGSDQDIEMGPVHLLYCVPLPSSVQSMSVCSAEPKMFGAYSFRSKISLGWKYPEESFIFSTASESDKDFTGKTCRASSIGFIRLHTANNEFERARELVYGAGMERLMNDRYAHFHPAEIALQKLRQCIESFNIDDESWPETLRAFERGAGHRRGQQVLLQAADSILNWPQISSKSAQIVSTLSRVIRFISPFVCTFKRASNDFFDEETLPIIASKYEEKLIALEDKLSALEYLERIKYVANGDGRAGSLPSQAHLISVASADDLFATFVKIEEFHCAEKLCQSSSLSNLSLANMVNSVLQIPHSIHPERYIPLLTDVVFPRLSINHELLPPILTWACRMADELDDAGDNGMDQAILLLRATEKAIKRLRLRVHSSFAHYSPFVDHLRGVKSKHRLKRSGETNNLNDSDLISCITDMSCNLSEESESQHLRSFTEGERKKTTPFVGTRPNPTILDIGRMKKGAQKTTALENVSSLRIQSDDENEESVTSKLEAARLLRQARSLGLVRGLVMLRDFIYRGGAQFLCKELLRLFSSGITSHEQRYNDLNDYIFPFCVESAIVFDESLVFYVKELCVGKGASPEAIEEAGSIARCCRNPPAKCQITLITLQSALFCHFSPAWLKELSADAIEWSAGDLSVRCELEEASRLLLIDEIVGRYCGNGAKELFHVDNALHASRLLEYVCSHQNNPSVLADVLALCDAFHHLSAEEGCARLIEGTVLDGKQKEAAKHLGDIYYKDKVMAINVYSRVMTFCFDIMEEVPEKFVKHCERNIDRKMSKQLEEVDAVTSCALELTKVASRQTRSMIVQQSRGGFSPSHYSLSKLERLAKQLERIKTLQSEFGVYLCISDFDRPDVVLKVASLLVSEIIHNEKEFIRGTGMIISPARRVCTLLTSGMQHSSFDDDNLLCAASIEPILTWSSKDLKSFDLFTDFGMLEASTCEVASRCCLALSLFYCTEQSRHSNVKRDMMTRMQGVTMASSLLQDYALNTCKDSTLGTTTSFAVLCDIVSQLFLRADGGYGEDLDAFRKNLLGQATEKRWSFASLNNQKLKTELRCDVSKAAQVSFHPTWYIGDGLLLPPADSLLRGVEYCNQCMGIQRLDDPLTGLEAFVSQRSGHALALRIFCHSTTVQLSRSRIEVPVELLEEYRDNLVLSLVERYLGGTSAGMTNGVVDSQMAASNLLALPMKLAFKIFTSSLPTAINMRDFPRVVTLAAVGTIAGSTDSSVSDFRSTWTHQAKFVNQCDTLATKATWWSVLEDRGIQFDPHRFHSNKDGSDQREAAVFYESSMITKLVASLLQTPDSFDLTLRSITRYASDFALPTLLPIQSFVSYLLCPDLDVSVHDVRSRVSDLESMTRALLCRVQSQTECLTILRKCLLCFEESENSTDYERLSVILSLYQDGLASVLAHEISDDNGQTEMYFKEMELIDRRRDALAILSSFFHGEKIAQRPLFSHFFLPLPKELNEIATSDRVLLCSVLGWEGPVQDSNAFDPLQPLDEILRSTCSSDVASALSPLCLPLGVPRGYIRARSLISKFQRSQKEGAVLPSLGDVINVLNLLRRHSDVAELGEWCSGQYSLENPDKVKCLDHALSAAIKASNEAERNACKASMKDVNETIALSRVKRINASKDLISDRLAVNTILGDALANADRHSSFAYVLEKLTSRIETDVWSKFNVFLPETFVEMLLEIASELSANAAIDSDRVISLRQFRHLSRLSHRICDSIAEKYSHVQVGLICRRLTSRWLFHGDEQTNRRSEDTDDHKITNSNYSNTITAIEKEDTFEFKMDLSMLQDHHGWALGARSGTATKKDDKQRFDIESDCLTEASERERSEFASTRCALRVAFVMAFANGYFSNSPRECVQTSHNGDENLMNHQSLNSKSKRRGLLSKLKTSMTAERNYEDDRVLEHCRELLQMVFARSITPTRMDRILNTSIDTKSSSGRYATTPTTTTFSMRHRCLRVASILLPQEALDEVLRKSKGMTNQGSLSLMACTFGAFCAKELEEMSLPVPHSDLLQLSNIHFPSYARALWRHHRDIKGSKGRLLLLVLDLYLKEPISDYEFFKTVLREIGAQRLPRTLLLAFETVTRFVTESPPLEAFLKATNSEMTEGLTALAESIVKHLKYKKERTDLDKDASVVVGHGVSLERTLDRYVQILCCLSEFLDVQTHLVELCPHLLAHLELRVTSEEERIALTDAARKAISKLDADDLRLVFESKVNKVG